VPLFEIVLLFAHAFFNAPAQQRDLRNDGVVVAARGASSIKNL
jgi:hypothetical protein